MKTNLFLTRLTLTISVILFTGSIWAAIPHGSIRGVTKLYTQYEAGTLNPTTVKLNGNDTILMDFKVVTVGGKSKAETTLTHATIGGEGWSSQLRYWSATNAKTENNLTGRVGNTGTFGSTTATIPNPLQITFFQSPPSGEFWETPRYSYDITIPNSVDANDNVAPTLTDVTYANVTETTVDLTFTGGGDNSGNFFYHISDGAGVVDVSFQPTVTVTGLSGNTSYTLIVTPIDFSGNEGTPKTVSFTTSGLVQITSGVAKDIKFMLLSSAGRLDYYYELTDPTKTFHDAFIQIKCVATGLPGGTASEWKPVVEPGSSNWVSGTVIDNRLAANAILELNMGYLIYETNGPNWGNYVVDNTKITAGALNGTPIKHAVGQGINPDEAEAVEPVLAGATLDNITTEYVELTLSGSDNSGSVYFEITGGKSTVNVLHAGVHRLTEIEAGNLYTLSIAAKDLSGNSSEPEEIIVRTSNKRSNVVNDQGCGYNNVAATNNPELVVFISQPQAGQLTVGCTTASSKITQASYYGHKFGNPRIEINGVVYPLTLTNLDSVAATYTFTDNIGETPIATGTPLRVKWLVTWSGGGAFVTGTFDYIIGDFAQTDTEAPSAPELLIVDGELTWDACTDNLSGVVKYVVREEGLTPVTIWNRNETAFSYTLQATGEPAVAVTVYDYVGNFARASIGEVGTEFSADDNVALYPNPAVDLVYFTKPLKEVIIYNMQGIVVEQASLTAEVNVSRLPAGLYMVKAIADNNITKILKLTVSK